MMHLVHLLALATAATASFQLPTGSPDGVYSSQVLSTGEQAVYYHGTNGSTDGVKVENVEFNATPAIRGRAPTPLVARDYGVFCANQPVSQADMDAAANGLISTWDNVAWSARSISYVSGSAQAYACNYGGSQTTHASDWNPDMQQITATCGPTGSGWFSHASEWKVTFGKGLAAASIC